MALTSTGRSRGAYSSQLLDQQKPVVLGDVLPADPAARTEQVRALVRSATIYGLPSVLQCVEMGSQALDRTSERFTGFNTFAHDRALASPEYEVFTTPNADTLYSNAWLDLTAGPVLLEIPPVGDRYFTVSLLDMYSNAVNLSTRTVGTRGGRFLVALGDWEGEVPAGMTCFRVATPHMWALVRIFCGDDEEDLTASHRLQDDLVLRPVVPERVRIDPDQLTSRVPRSREEALTDWRRFLECLDMVLHVEGYPREEKSQVHSWGSLGLGTGAWDATSDVIETHASVVREGFEEALEWVRGSRHLLGNPIPGAGWNRGSAGRYGQNHLRRAVANYVGLGATTSEENQAFTTFSDGQGRALDGAARRYGMRFVPPPVGAFWSVTVYDVASRRLVSNPIDRHTLNSGSRNLEVAEDGSVDVVFSVDRPASGNWLPCPAGPFYAVIRAYLPLRPVREGGWAPVPILPLADG